MKIGKNLAIIISIIFFFELLEVFLFAIYIFAPEFRFSDNQIIRIIFLVALVYLTRLFYNFLINESEEEKSKTGRVVLGSNDFTRKIAVVFVLVFFMVSCSLFILSIYN